MNLKFFIVCCVYLMPVLCYNILGVFPHQGKSHYDVFEPLMIRLSEIGHNVTVISHFPRTTTTKPSNTSYHDIDLKVGTTKVLQNVIDMKMVVNRTRMFQYFGALPLRAFAEESCAILGAPKLQHFLNTDSNFDLIIIEMFTTDCFLGLAYRFEAPFIGISSSVIMPWMNDRFGNIDNPSYIPVMFMDFSDRMSFLQRMENTIALILNKIIHSIYFDVPGYNTAKRFISKALPQLNIIAKNASLFLVNSHFSLNRPRPFVPNIIEVGGIHLTQLKPLPKNLETYINGSPNGVIYFSMGSMIKAHTFPEEKRKAFLGAFSKLKERVLWKWENESLPDKPNNVMIQKWMPQLDILCHPNIVAFISHGGLLGTTEAVHCGVPMIVMPQYGDQFTNAKAIEATGAGVILNFAEVTEESVLNALNTVLQPSFQKGADKLSEVYRDRPMSPMDTAIYWVEYVARHGGAHHMKTAAVDLPIYQYLLLDVIAFILITVLIILTFIYYICKLLIKLIFKRNQKQKLH